MDSTESIFSQGKTTRSHAFDGIQNVGKNGFEKAEKHAEAAHVQTGSGIDILIHLEEVNFKNEFPITYFQSISAIHLPVP